MPSQATLEATLASAIKRKCTLAQCSEQQTQEFELAARCLTLGCLLLRSWGHPKSASVRLDLDLVAAVAEAMTNLADSAAQGGLPLLREGRGVGQEGG